MPLICFKAGWNFAHDTATFLSMAMMALPGVMNAGHLGPGQLGPKIYRPGPILPTFFIRDASMKCVS